MHIFSTRSSFITDTLTFHVPDRRRRRTAVFERLTLSPQAPGPVENRIIPVNPRTLSVGAFPRRLSEGWLKGERAGTAPRPRGSLPPTPPGVVGALPTLPAGGGDMSKAIGALAEEVREQTRRSEAPSHRGCWKISRVAGLGFTWLHSGHFLFSERRGFPLWPPDLI